MDILLTRIREDDGWQPLPLLIGAWQRGDECRLAFVVATARPDLPLGAMVPLDAAALKAPANSLVKAESGVELFVADFAPPPDLLLLGGGPDARPVAELAGFLGWRVTVVDHRNAYLQAARFPENTHLIPSRAAEVGQAVQLDDYSAAIVMSHHLDSDLEYLRALAASRVPYVGLLGPAARRETLLHDLGADALKLRPRLRAPVGLDIGGRAPESIALSIIGEVHAVLAGRGGRPFSETTHS
jgi:xanthine/CO dehydrogenase XdhC/CoxF family maturation factor